MMKKGTEVVIWSSREDPIQKLAEEVVLLAHYDGYQKAAKKLVKLIKTVANARKGA